jgi:hypothetical protein
MPYAEVTYQEALTLHLLKRDGSTEEYDTSACRFLINSGFAERFDPGMMRITDEGVERLSSYVEKHGANFGSSFRP